MKNIRKKKTHYEAQKSFVEINIGNLVPYFQESFYINQPVTKEEVFDVLKRVGGNYGAICKVKISLKKFLLTDSFPQNFPVMIHMQQTLTTSL